MRPIHFCILALCACDSLAPTTTEQVRQSESVRDRALSLPARQDLLAVLRRELQQMSIHNASRRPEYGYVAGPLVGSVPPTSRESRITPLPLLVEVPETTVNIGGALYLRFRTSRRALAKVYYGTRVSESPFSQPRYRFEVRAQASDEEFGFLVRADLRRLLQPTYDVENFAESGRGSVAWQVELTDEQGSTALYEGETHFSVSSDGFRKLPSLTLAPEVDMVTEDAATISFTADEETAACVAYFDDRQQVLLAEDPRDGERHELRLSDLRPDTTYRYQPILMNRDGELSLHRGGTFRTRGLEDFEFVVLGDSRSGYGVGDEHYGGTNGRVLRTLFTQIIAHTPRFVVFNGDLIDGYTTHPKAFAMELEMWKHIMAPYAAHLPIFEGMGNHEALIEFFSEEDAAYRTDVSGEQIFAELFVNPTNAPAETSGMPTRSENVFSFDEGNVHIAVVNSNYAVSIGRSDRGQREGTVDDEQLRWLDADLRSARRAGAQHLLVITHEPPFPSGGHADDGMYWNGDEQMSERRNRFLRILGEHDVAAVLCADEHNYSRLPITDSLVPGLANDLVQIVSGGAGAPYYARDRNVPWAGDVARFDPRQHFLLFRTNGNSFVMEAIDTEGATIERVVL